MKLKFEFQISEPAYELLKKIREAGYAEYRDPEFDNLVHFKRNVREQHQLTEEQFLARNFGGTYDLVFDLLKFNLVEMDDNSWHTTFRITEIGESVLNQNQ